VAGHVFVSYSHHDHAYIAQLSQHLRTYGFQPLTDEGIEPGDQWAHTIEDHVRTCAAFIPVMSINSRKADWVRREILFAQDLQKPILPLLLSGTRFIELVDLDDEDVTTGAMPRQPFMTRLHSILFAELTNLHGEAVSLGISGERAEAVQILREVVAARTRVLGAEHADTLESRYELAFSLGISGKKAETAAKNAPTWRTLREVYAAQRRVLEAVRILREVVPAQTRVLGAEHPDTRSSVEALRTFE
jgi:hypothetical protein